MAEWFKLDALKFLVSEDWLIGVSDDDGDGKPDNGVMEEARTLAVKYCRDKARAGGYSPKFAEWEADADLDGVCDAVPHTLVRAAIFQAIYLLGSRRRHGVDKTVRLNFEDSEKILDAIASGDLPLEDSTATVVLDVDANKDEYNQNLSLNGLDNYFPFPGAHSSKLSRS